MSVCNSHATTVIGDAVAGHQYLCNIHTCVYPRDATQPVLSLTETAIGFYKTDPVTRRGEREKESLKHKSSAVVLMA
jgi:hypothetical protein